jgi:hypothetical protein
LTIWGNWGGAAQMREWVRKLVMDREGLLLMLRTLRGTVRSYGGSIPREEHYYRLSDVEPCIDPPALSALVEQLDLASLAADDAANVGLFRKAMDRRAQGKPDYSLPSID